MLVFYGIRSFLLSSNTLILESVIDLWIVFRASSI
jgi:hypothetical protein